MKTVLDKDDPNVHHRHAYGPRPVGQLLPRITRPAFRKRSPAAAQLMADWPEVVGPALAAVTAPRRLSGTTLVLGCPGPVALELQHLSAELAARINAHLGRTAVTGFRFVQDTAPTQAAPAPAAQTARPPVPLPGIAPGALYDALQALAKAVRRP